MYPFKNQALEIDGLQFACNSRWEEVQIVRRNCSGDLKHLLAWLSTAPRDVAAEALFFDEQSNLKGFVGIRTINPPSAQRTLSWLQLVLSSFSHSTPKLEDLLSDWLRALGFDTEMPSNEPTYELGVFNYWKSAKPLLLGHNPARQLEFIEQSVEVPSWFKEGHTAPICFEYVWKRPTPLWISLVVSDVRDGRHYLNRATLEAAWSQRKHRV